MKNEDFVGVDGDTLTITQPTDIYPLLDWCQSAMMEKEDEAQGTKNKEKWNKAIEYLNTLLIQVEKAGFGNQEDVDNIEQ